MLRVHGTKFSLGPLVEKVREEVLKLVSALRDGRLLPRKLSCIFPPGVLFQVYAREYFPEHPRDIQSPLDTFYQDCTSNLFQLLQDNLRQCSAAPRNSQEKDAWFPHQVSSM